MNELKIRDLFAADPFEDAFRNFLRPWVSRGVAQAPDIKVDLTESNGDYKLKAATRLCQPQPLAGSAGGPGQVHCQVRKRRARTDLAQEGHLHLQAPHHFVRTGAGSGCDHPPACAQDA